MATAIVTALFTFLLTGLVANRLVQRWQYGNWRSQQKLADTEQQYRAVQDLFDEVAALASKRQHKMRRLVSALRDNDAETLKQRLGDYDIATLEWNERLNAIFAKLTMYLRWHFTKRLEDEIQSKFVELGRELESMTRSKLSGTKIPALKLNQLERELNRLQARLFRFNRDVLRFMQEQKSALYREPPFTSETLDRFPTWELLKALFIPRIKREDI